MATSRKYTSQGNPKLQQHVIVYMDILGYTETIRNAERNGRSQSQLEELYTPLKHAREWLEFVNHIRRRSDDGSRPRFYLKSFSDNIVMGWPIEHSAPNGAGECLRHALKKVGSFQLDMATRGFFVRGTIAVGDIFIDDMVVYGPGLLDAIHAEEELAITPRIILRDSAIEVAERYRVSYWRDEKSPLSSYIWTDQDGQRFVNYLDAACPDSTIDHQMMVRHQTTVAKKLIALRSKLKEWQKIHWVARYHNLFCDRDEKHFGQYKIVFDEYPIRLTKKIVLASNNAGKLREFAQLFAPLGIELLPQSAFNVSEAEEPHATFVENALAKARHCAQLTGLPALADDSGLCVRALDGAPGVFSARYAGEPKSDARNNDKLLAELRAESDRRAHYVCVLALCHSATDPQPLITEGEWHGEILTAPRGSGGFGYDPLFFVPSHGCSAAELDAAEKNRISHRGTALQLLLQRLRLER